MSINPQKLTAALAKLNIPTGEQVQFAKVAQSLGIIPKKMMNGKETKQLLKEGSQKYKEFVYNEIMKRYELALQADRERELKRQNAQPSKPKIKPRLVKRDVVDSLLSKQFQKEIFQYEGNEDLLDLYQSIKRHAVIGSFVQLVFKHKTENKVLQTGIEVPVESGRSLAFDYLEPSTTKNNESLSGFETFKQRVEDLIDGKGTAEGSDPLSSDEWMLDLNTFVIGGIEVAAGSKSDDIIFESKNIESKFNFCSWQCMLECGVDCKKLKLDPKDLQSLPKLIKVITDNKLPIAIYSNGFTLKNKIDKLFDDDALIKKTIYVTEKKREIPYCCIEITEDIVNFVQINTPLVPPVHYLVYDEVNKHLDYLTSAPKLKSKIYLTRSSKVINNNKVIFTAKNLNDNNMTNTGSAVEYIFFDYETVIDFNNSSCMQSYSVSVLPLNDNELQSLELYDKESVGENSEFALNEIDKIRQTKCKTFMGYDCGSKLIEWFREYSKNKVCVFIGFNNTNFDNFLILEDFLKFNAAVGDSSCFQVGDIFYNGSQLLNFIVNGRHSFFDIRKHLVGSLKANCKSFKIESCAKKDCDHAYMQLLHQEGKLIDYINSDDKLKEYNEYDVLATAVLYRRYVNALDSVAATKPYAQSIYNIKTIGSLIYKVFEDNKRSLDFKLPKLDYKLYTDLQKSKIAGRVEMFNGVQKVMERLVSTDVCSLYPFVMAVLNCYYPCGSDIIKVDEYKGDNQLGFYYCDINQSNLRLNNLPNIYAKKCEVENDWGYEGVLENYLISNVMIGLLRKYNCTVVVKEGFVFPEKKKSCEMFGFLLDFMAEKNKQDELSRNKSSEYNPALRETLKLLMNSLSGKVIEGLHTEKTVDVDTVAEYLKILDKAKTVNFINSIAGKMFVTYEIDEESVCEKQQRPIYLGVLIYDYAKRYMFENSYSKVGKAGLLYTDTDASKFRYSDFIKWKDWIDTNNVIVPHWEEVEKRDPRYKTHKIYESDSKVFGSFEDELEGCVGDEYVFYCLEKKSWLYAYKKGDDWKSKYRFKGLNGGAQLLSLEEPFIGKRMIKEEEEKYYIKPESELEVYNYYENNKKNNLETGNEIKFFDQVYTTGVAYVLSNSFRKIVKNSARNVVLENVDGYNNLMNKIQVQYNMKKINIYKKK